MKNFLRTVVASGLVLVAISCKPAEEAEQVSTAVNVRTVIVAAQTFTEKVGALGVISTQPGKSASLSAPGPTRVSRVNGAVGDRVARGQAIVVFEQSVFREAATSAAAKVSAAQHAYDRARALSQAGIIPRKDVEQASADLAAARSDLVAARRTSDLSILRSPINGVITKISATLGASVDASQTLVEIADPSALDAILGMTPTDAGKVHVGDKVELRAGQNQQGEMLGVATVRDISPGVDSLSRNVPVRAVAATTSRPLRIGELVYGDITIASRANVVTIPVEALVPEGDGFRVFVVDDKNVVHARAVKTGARAAKLAEITEGLTPGLRIVTFGAYGLQDGATVVPGK